MNPVLVKRDEAPEHTVAEGETLVSIVGAKAPEFGWKTLALLNFGTVNRVELLRALIEHVGVDVKTLSEHPSIDPQTLKLKPHPDLPAPKLKLPKIWKSAGFELKKTHKIKVKRLRPANAVRIEKLDKWFLPETENCDVEWGVEGEKATADKLELAVYASNYADCTALNHGQGTWDQGAGLHDTPVFHNAMDAQERDALKYEWTGECNTDAGPFGRKPSSMAKRHINVAFSPYTVQMRSWKADGDRNARIALKPFWPEFELAEAAPAATVDVAASPAPIAWTNADKRDSGAVEIRDAIGQRVFHAVIEDAKLAAGAQTIDWDRAYLPGLVNGRFGSQAIDDTDAAYGALRVTNELVWRSTPYVVTVKTCKRSLKADSLKIKWTVKNANGKLKHGHIRIVDGANKLVQLIPLPEGKLSDGDQETTWDGKYAAGLKNSADGDEAIEPDMPYRVTLEAHSAVDVDEGLALAVAHSEVRLYTHAQSFAPSDLRYEPSTMPPSMPLRPAEHVPGAEPATNTDDWLRAKLADAGFPAGPYKARGPEGQAAQVIAVKEFKRSVPKNGAPVAPAVFERMTLQNGADAALDGELRAALQTLRGSDRRLPYGDPTMIRANSEAPDLSADEVKARLLDCTKQIALWVDDRQYYTRYALAKSKDEANQQFTTGDAARDAFGLGDYRGGMVQADIKVAQDAAAIPRPWVPLKAEPTLMSKADKLFDAPAAAKAAPDPDDEKTKAMRRAIGPIRIDWVVRDLPFELSTDDLDPQNDYVTPNPPPLNDGWDVKANEVRTRKFAAWAIQADSEPHARKDTGLEEPMWNAHDTKHGGVRPTAAAQYFDRLFGFGEDGLDPWRPRAEAADEVIATIVHDHIVNGQDEATEWFEPLVGAAGAYFRPSIMAGDGYRVGARVNFKKHDDWQFPNADVLAARYPRTPEVQGPAMRVWRRSSIRGHARWAAGGAGANWPGNIAGVRRSHRAAHVYFVHEGGAPTHFAINRMFDPATDQDRFKNIVRNNFSPGYSPHNAVYTNRSRMRLRGEDVWPWGHRDDLGWEWPSPEGLTQGQTRDQWLDTATTPGANADCIVELWEQFGGALLLGILKRAEEQGYMRGHLLVEFNASPPMDVVQYKCNGATQHVYHYVEAQGTTAHIGRQCLTPNCRQPAPPPLPPPPPPPLGIAGPAQPPPVAPPAPAPPAVLAHANSESHNSVPLFAVGLGLGSTWLFDGGWDLWAHEMGHHRHFEHAATAPGATPPMHDSAPNTAAAPLPYLPSELGPPRARNPQNANWDRRCVMTYTQTDPGAGTGRCFCGKCLLRHRGWKVTGIANMDSAFIEPT